MRKQLPAGEEGHNLNPETLECPVCSCRLVPSELVINDGESELWYVECRYCGTEYLTQQPIGRLSLPKPITREYVLSLEQRISRLEYLLTHQQVVPQREEKPKSDTLSEYAFLLNT